VEKSMESPDDQGGSQEGGNLSEQQAEWWEEIEAYGQIVKWSEWSWLLAWYPHVG